MKLILVGAGIGITLTLGAFICSFAFKIPSNDRVWNESFARLATVAFANGTSTVAFADIRDWTYTAEGPATKEYVNQNYSLDSLTGMDFLVEPFPSNPAIGHTFLIFTFSDAPPVAFSIEARIEVGQKYSGLNGLFNAYELAYTWGTERDFITRRTVWLGHDLYRYHLTLPLDQARFVFRAFVEGTQNLETHPMFYNTVLHNCTNELARLINAKAPDTLPWDWSRIFTGTADKYLFDLGYIQGSDWETVHANAKVPK